MLLAGHLMAAEQEYAAPFEQLSQILGDRTVKQRIGIGLTLSRCESSDRRSYRSWFYSNTPAILKARCIRWSFGCVVGQTDQFNAWNRCRPWTFWLRLSS